jgi:hypothetical protein
LQINPASVTAFRFSDIHPRFKGRFTQSWGIAGAPSFFYTLSKGDFTPLAQSALGFRRAPVGSMMAAAMVCASGASEGRLKTVSREATQTA